MARKALTDQTIAAALTALGVTDFTVGKTGGGMCGIGWELDAMAPTGMKFYASDAHCLVVSRSDDEPLARLRRDAMHDVKLGLVPCTDPACENCHD